MRRPALTAAVLALFALTTCGGDDGDDAESTVAATDVSLVPVTPPPTVPTPSVELPDEPPTEVITTVLTEGAGRPAETGDTVIVNYVGVSYETGEQFGQSYGGDPFSFTLGDGGVIVAWDESLVGAQAGSRLQLDVPAENAYGPTPTTTAGAATSTTLTPGPPTGPLSFVIDVLGVVPPVDPAAAPTADDIPTLCDGPRATGPTASTGPPATTAAPASTAAGPSDTSRPDQAECDEHATVVLTTDVVAGDGATAEMGLTAVVRFVLARADNGVILRSTWDEPAPTQVLLAPSGPMDGMIDGIVGMQVGGRRTITIPYAEAFGESGFPEVGLPARTDAVVIVDLLAVY